MVKKVALSNYFMYTNRKGCVPMKNSKIKVLYLFVGLMIITSLFLDPFPELLSGMNRIITESDILISDYIEIGGFGATLFNASVLALGSIIVIRVSKAEMNGQLIATLMLMVGFGLFGKNILNVVSIVLGSYLYARYSHETFSDVVHIGLLATSFSPIVTEIMFILDLNIILRIILSQLVGLSVGFIITPISRHLMQAHKGYTLYNVGFAIGLLGTIYVSVMKLFGFQADQQLVLSSGNNLKMSVALMILFLLTFLYGLYLSGFKFDKLLKLFDETGYKNNDFVKDYGVGPVLMNMAINGVVALFYVVILAEGDLHGPSIGGILVIFGFGGFGKHWQNIIPIFFGVYLGGLIGVWDLSAPSSLFAALFGTALAPVVGEFGIVVGVVISFINAAVALNSGMLHGGLNLYNTGFSVGLVAAVLVPLVEILRRHEKVKIVNKRKTKN